MMAKTEKGKEIRKYYVKLENVFNQITDEQRIEYQKELEHHKQLLALSENEKNNLREKTLLEQFVENVQCFYYGVIDNTSTKGKAISRSVVAIGIALRNKSLCNGYIFRYAGISLEDQMSDQPVIKVNCNNGELTNFPNIASAAKDANISAPALRNRILTDVHVNNCHWVFDKTSTHYT